MTDVPEMCPKRLSEREVASLLDRTVRTLRAWRAEGKGPPYVRLGRKRVMYNELAVRDWVLRRTFQGAARCPTCGGWTSTAPSSEDGAAHDE